MPGETAPTATAEDPPELDPPGADPDAPDDAPPIGAGRELDLIVAAAALFVLVAYAPGLDQGPTTLRFLVVAPLGAAGLVVLARLAAARDRAAWWALGFLGWALLATLASDDVRQSLVPGFGTARGWLAMAVFFGWYGVGRRRGRTGEALLIGALVTGLVLTSALAVAQAVFDGEELLSLSEGRALGFTPSPVYLGTLLAGAIPFAPPKSSDSSALPVQTSVSAMTRERREGSSSAKTAPGSRTTRTSSGRDSSQVTSGSQVRPTRL